MHKRIAFRIAAIHGARRPPHVEAVVPASLAPRLTPLLRAAAALLLILPSAVAALCFAHGHGALGGAALGAAVTACAAAGAVVALRLVAALKPVQTSLRVMRRAHPL